MSKITSSLLTDTLNVIALARETALARGVKDQADRLTPVVDGLRTVATAARQSRPADRPAAAKTASSSASAAAPAAPTAPAAATGPTGPVAPTGALAQEDFKTLLVAAQKAPLNAPAEAGGSAASRPTQDRSQVVSAMSAGGMGEVEIARQLGVSREEIRLMLSNPGNSASRTPWTSVKAYWR
jgi:hypothetical protein